MKQPDKKTKIIVTLGPATSTCEEVTKLILCGADIIRINFSHGDKDSRLKLVQAAREASEKLNIQIPLIGDLQGPKIRTGLLDQNIIKDKIKPINPGDHIFLSGDKSYAPPYRGSGDSIESPIFVSLKTLFDQVDKGSQIFLDDGMLTFEVVDKIPENKIIKCSVIEGEFLAENKGVNIPAMKSAATTLSEKDWEDVQFCLDHNLEFIAYSFVMSHKEVKSLKEYLDKQNAPQKIIAKIEKNEALNDLEEIIKYCEGALVARGDLGVEIGNHKVPGAQKIISRLCKQEAKICIIATQMLTHMVNHAKPTRAEASDIANAVLEKNDALMLSNETTVGKYPFKAVEIMKKIIIETEANQLNDPTRNRRNRKVNVEITKTEAIERSAVNIANGINAAAIACLSRTGQSARFLSKYHPSVPIYVFTPNEIVASQLNIRRGLYPIFFEESKSNNFEIFDYIHNKIKELNLIEENSLLVISGGFPPTMNPGSTNTLMIKGNFS